MFRDDGAGGDDAAFADVSVVKHSGTHTDDDVIANDAAMDSSVVADRDPITHDDGIEVALAVEDSTVLDVGAGADADGIDVAAQDRVHPDRGLFAEDDVAKDLRGGVDVTAGGDFGVNALIGSDHCNLIQECRAERAGRATGNARRATFAASTIRLEILAWRTFVCAGARRSGNFGEFASNYPANQYSELADGRK